MFAATANSPLDEEGVATANLRQDTALELPSRPESRAYSLLPGNLEMPEAAIAPPTPTGPPPFEPLGEHDVYDVFDLELTLAAGGKEAGIDVRYRSSDNSSSGRPTYKITKKTKAHFLGRKNMTVEVSRNLAWDSTTGAPTNNGSKGYTNVFSARDQASRSVALRATNSVLSKTTLGGVIDVSTVCGAYDPSRAPQRETPAHHFFTLKLNPSCAPAPEKAAHGTPRKRPRGNNGAIPSPTPPQPQPYTGGGHFVFDSAPRGRSDLLSTLYCTGYELRPHARAGDIAVAELRLTVRPGAAAAPPWARFFKERHAALHVARRGLDACMTGPHVEMLVPGLALAAAAADTQGPGQGLARRAVLARGQALECVLAALGTALLAVEHDGLEGKRWAWLVRQQQQQQQRPSAGLGPAGAAALAPLAPVPSAEDNPGLASPDCEGGASVHSDDSQGASPGLAAFEAHIRANGGGGGLFAPQAYTPSISERSEEELDEWVEAGDAAVPAHPAQGQEAPRGGTWARKNSVMSERSVGEGPLSPSALSAPQLESGLGLGMGMGSKTPHHHQHQHQHHLKAGSWPEKTLGRRSVALMERSAGADGLALPFGDHANGNRNGHGGGANNNANGTANGPPPSTFSRSWGDKHQHQHQHQQHQQMQMNRAEEEYTY
ncbi:hypothetical protein B0H14DRAFT_1675411 [Mycena olivaceomarginata]|nr:hypothetical protein B0H14DRAFT_1675411 [Mycena olivaceomarginata]